MRKYLCGVDTNECMGAMHNISGGGRFCKAHSSTEEAFRCYTRSLINKGYIKVGEREYKSPDGPIMLVSKKSKFGTVLRRGKTEQGTTSSGKRLTTLRAGGAIVSN